ncbi:MAG: 50S ribosomal protein L23 [Woeseiaceae bacterium]|nr:50S ribosomal protein L23 [Woeseiaceae bacterium]
MHQERLMTVIQGPHLSEKSAIVAEKGNQVVFKVRPDASKTEIRQAVELLFDVKVDGVSVVNVKGKVKRFGRVQGRRSDWKKAYVRLAEGSEIDFLGAE